MIIPLHLLPDLNTGAPIPLDFTLNADSPSSLRMDMRAAPELDLPIAGPVALSDLHCFQALMADEGEQLQPTRMLYDRLYAFECLARAHACSNPGLRALALRLFSDYQRAGEWIGLMH
ncbi:hypothetical protein [Kinneretia aquatilis]|uniref:hypothetical protein n=1 Tax=Kinneretia aquatilis TaxID=2070761 RepID=UPI000BD8E2D4|nr:hypothetical protein [Paucibacter aquatile]MCZ8072825.1 hypothetical protein [Roseateles sp.]OYU28669.1 MAG: hypothetical protein CFE41_05090 [Burkholderiales bacterium PBB2]WIV99464.1 hypothetical protein K9V56_008280 [Paucibacter aquatile]